MRMNATVLKSLFCLACVSAFGICSDLRAHESDADALLRINREILEGMLLRQDPAALLEHTHPEFTVVAPGGRVESREQVVAGVQSVDAKGLEISGEQATIVGDTGLLVGRLDIDGEMQPVGKLGPMKFMAIFIRQDGEWKLLSRALTPCLEVAIERGVC